MAEVLPVPSMKEFSPTMRVDVTISDWRAALPIEITAEEKERRLYLTALEAYLAGDFGFGLWCWHESDRLSNAVSGSVGEVVRILGAGKYFGFSHRRAVCAAVPLDKVHRPRKGEMSRPRPDAIVLAPYQLLCVYAVRSQDGDIRAKAQLEIALLELDDRRRADPYLKHFETFRALLARSGPGSASRAAAA